MRARDLLTSLLAIAFWRLLAISMLGKAYARHPIYSGLLLTMASITMASGSVSRLLTLGVLVLLLTVKARWEETRLMRRIEGYADYAARTPRFVPRLRR